MAESFYAGLFRSIQDKLSGSGKAPKESKGKKVKDGEATPVKKKPSTGKGGIAVGRILVDLTPEAYREATRTRELKKRWTFTVAGALAFAVLVTSVLFTTSIPAKSSLDSALESNAQLQTALGKYKEVNQAVEEQGATKDKLNLAAGGAINWSTLFLALQGALPDGTSIASMGVNTAAASTDKGAAIRINFSSKSPLGYADTLKAIQSAKGVSNVQVGGLTSVSGGFSFSATLDYDSSIRTNRFAPSNSTGGN